MKTLKTIVKISMYCAALTLIFWGINSLRVSHNEQYRTEEYCGKVNKLFVVGEGSYAQSHVVFYSEKLKRNIDVSVSWNTYSNLEKGKKVCFDLDQYDLKN